MKRWRPSWWLVPLGVAAALVLVTNVFPFRQILVEGAKVEEARTTLAALEEENTKLAARVEALGTPAEIERLAREKLGYVREGEVAYVILPPEGSPTTAAGEEAEPEGVDEPAWYERIWDFLTGADLAGQG